MKEAPRPGCAGRRNRSDPHCLRSLCLKGNKVSFPLERARGVPGGRGPGRAPGVGVDSESRRGTGRAAAPPGRPPIVARENFGLFRQGGARVSPGHVLAGRGPHPRILRPGGWSRGSPEGGPPTLSGGGRGPRVAAALSVCGGPPAALSVCGGSSVWGMACAVLLRGRGRPALFL